MEKDVENVPDWLIPNRVYDVMKWLGLVVFPALAVFVQAIAPAWGIDDAAAIVLTLNALGTLVGVVIGASALKGGANED